MGVRWKLISAEPFPIRKLPLPTGERLLPKGIWSLPKGKSLFPVIEKPADAGLSTRASHPTPLDKTGPPRQTAPMDLPTNSPLDALWTEYGRAFAAWDDLTLGRWLAQTLGQLEGRAWRLSHPLLGAYRLAAQVAHGRQIWSKRLATAPAGYAASSCCRAPFLPLLTRDVRTEGLICQHCNEILVPFDELPAELRAVLEPWAKNYEPVHAVAHWDDRQRKRVGNYDVSYENAALSAEKLLTVAGSELAPKLLDSYAAVIWEDQDECLEVRPEDVKL